MINYWLEMRDMKVKTYGVYDNYIEVETSLGNRFRCWVVNNMLNSASSSKRYRCDDLMYEQEWELVERHAQDLFLKAGLLKEKVWD